MRLISDLSSLIIIRRHPSPPLFPYTTLFRSVPAVINRGLAYLGLGRFDRALADFDRALALGGIEIGQRPVETPEPDRKSTRLNSSHSQISYAVFCLKKKKKKTKQ